MLSLRKLSSLVLLLTTTLILFTGVVFGQSSKSTIAGEVRDEGGLPVEFVNVQIEHSAEGDATDVNGRFCFKTAQTGLQKMRFSLLGFEPAIATVRLSGADSVFVTIVLSEKLIDLKEVTINGSAYSTGDEVKGTTLRSLDVLTTPGTAADIFRAVQTFPGVIAVDEGSGLFVRGGDVSETVILLDQATVMHPYKFESPTGGYFGTIPPFLLSGTYFSTGGFSARYGDALSGILAMESLNLPKRQTWSLGVGLAAGSVGATIPITDNLGIRFSANKSLTDLMFRLNGIRNQFTLAPSGEDANVSVVYTYSNTGQLKLFNFFNTDRLGVLVDEPSFTGAYRSDETSWLHNLQWTDALGEWFAKVSLSSSRFGSTQQLGNLSLQPSDDSYKLRSDFDRFLTGDVRVSAGFEGERVTNMIQGTLPINSSVLDPEADVYHLDDRIGSTHAGGYAEVEKRLATRLTGSAGVRADFHSLGSEAVVDPRVSLRYDFSRQTNARLSWGIYHQNPQPMLFDRVSGNPNLRTQSAQHIVATLERTEDLLMIRVEGYYKSYNHLVIESKQDHYVNDGYGFANGLDVFIKYGGFLQTPFSGWISYSYLQSKRLQARDLVDRYVYEFAPSPYDITHNLTIVGKLQIIQFFSAGLTFRFATGRPATPIVGAVAEQNGAYYVPIQGIVGSDRYPNFARLDASLGYFLPYGEANSVTFYFAVSNLLNRLNPVRFEYSSDYSERRLRTTDYRRSVYFGFALSIGSLGGDF